MRIKPISIVAFLLTLVAVLLVLVGFWVPRWYVLLRSGGDIKHWYGLWHQQRCSSRWCGETSSFTRIEGGKEFFFISKVFYSLAALLVLLAFGLHVLYALWRKSRVRQVAIYMLCGAGLFGLVSMLIFAALYDQMVEYEGQTVELGYSFTLSLLGSLLCLLASAFTAWASYKKATFNEDDEDDCKEITHEMQPGGMD